MYNIPLTFVLLNVSTKASVAAPDLFDSDANMNCFVLPLRGRYIAGLHNDLVTVDTDVPLCCSRVLFQSSVSRSSAHWQSSLHFKFAIPGPWLAGYLHLYVPDTYIYVPIRSRRAKTPCPNGVIFLHVLHVFASIYVPLRTYTCNYVQKYDTVWTRGFRPVMNVEVHIGTYHTGNFLHIYM